ncbi:helix-turn-helix domain-containing protein, partial [Pelomicrobium sp. G1]|uniref:helix-turn-helix domain-containing protein n=1 Tax=Pelomicrobium sp. G1 TaxID=3452920 RepID=UPI003F7662D6
MSIRVMKMVWAGYPGGGSELLALLALADRADDEGRCYPSVGGIARRIRLSPRQTQRLIRALTERGYL